MVSAPAKSHELDHYDTLRREFAPQDTRVKRFLRRMGYVSTVLLILEGMAIASFDFGDVLPVSSWGRIAVMGAIATTWLALWIGYAGWLFTYCWMGFKRKKIW